MARDINLPKNSEIVSGNGGSSGREELVWGKGFRRVSLDRGKPLTRSEYFAGPRLFVKHYPDGRPDEYVYADAMPRRIKLPLVIVAGAICSVILPLLGRSVYNDITAGESPVWYVSTMAFIVAFVILLCVLIVKYLKGKGVVYEEIPADADPREKGKKYSGNFSGKAANSETSVNNGQFVPGSVFSSVSLILLAVLMLAGLGILGFGMGMFVTTAADKGFAVLFIVLGVFWFIMSLVGCIYSISSMVNAKKMMNKPGAVLASTE